MKIRNLFLLVAVVLSGCTTVQVYELNRDQKYARLLKLEDERSLGSGEIFNRLSEPDPSLRRRAALALGRIGDPEAAVPLANLLGDSAESVRVTAAFSLGLLDGPLPAEALDALSAALDDPADEVRARAIEALGRKASEDMAETIATELIERLPSGSTPFDWGEDIEHSALRLPHLDLRQGLYALANWKNLRWAWSILADEQAQARFLWWPAVWTASRFEDVEVAPLLLHYAGSSEPYYRVLGTRGLARLPAEHSRRAVIALLEDPDDRVRIEAVRAAAALNLAEVVPNMLALMETGNLFVKVEATRALAALPNPVTVEPIIDRLADPHPLIRSAALRALAFQDVESFWLLLSGLDDDADWTVRADLAHLLAGMNDDRAVSRLQYMIDDRDFRVRPHALRALAEASPELAGPVLIERLLSEDIYERAEAADGLRRLTPDGAVIPLQTAFDVSMSDKEPFAQLAIFSALEAYGSEAVEPVARRALDDPSWVVRKRAQDVLRRTGDPEAKAAEVGSGRLLDEYESLLHQQYTPHAYIRTEKGAIEVELFVVDAPLTVDNFIRLVREDFYDGLTFHIEPNEMVRTGSLRGDDKGGPGYTIRSEINRRPFMRGTMGMIEPGKDLGGSQFFITQHPQPQLEGSHTAFGQVLSGMDVIDQLVPGDIIREIVIWDGITPPDAAMSGNDLTQP
jgi:HEAT repeat protein/cyclophilin family peptidyl-prolyl cis-trans isomerase